MNVKEYFEMMAILYIYVTSRFIVTYTVGCLHAGMKIVGKIMVLGGIIVVEAESCHGRLEISTPP